MTDLIFLLLLFFVLITTIIVPNVNALKLVLPNAKGEITKDIKISVSITSKGQYAINGNFIGFSQLSPSLQAMTRDKKNPTVILHAERTVPIENVAKVMAIARDLKVKLVLATYPEK